MNWEAFDRQLIGNFGPRISPGINHWLPSGLTLLDAMMRGSRVDLVGGYPGGTFVELFGESQSGKTAACMRACALAQQRGALVVWVDIEGRFDETLALVHGLDIYDDSFKLFRPDTLEDGVGGLEILYEKFLNEETKRQKEHKKAPKKLGEFHSIPLVVVFDSLADFGAKNMMKKALNDATYKPLPMSIASVWSDFYRKPICRHIAGRNIFNLFINQVRTAVDFFASYGPPEVRTPGGHTIKHKCTTRLKFDALALDKFDKKGERKGAPMGDLVRIKGVKLAGPPGRLVLAPYYYHFGFDDALSCLNYLTAADYIKRVKASDGMWKLVINGEEATKLRWRRRFYKDPEFAADIRQFARDAYTEQCTYVEASEDADEEQCDEDEEE